MTPHASPRQRHRRALALVVTGTLAASISVAILAPSESRTAAVPAAASPPSLAPVSPSPPAPLSAPASPPAPGNPSAPVAAPSAAAATPVIAGPDAFQVSADPAVANLAGLTIPAGFVSLSVEAQSVVDGSFSAQTPGLLELLRGLRLGFLRVGANTGDSTPLSPAALTRLAQLSAAIPVPIVLQLPLRDDKPLSAVAEARNALRVLGSRLAALEIGNEPDAYALRGIRHRPWTYASFVKQRDDYRAALRSAGVTTPLWGPDDSGSQWLGSTVAERRRPYQAITQHFYPLSRCRPPTPTIRALLSEDILAKEQGEASLMAQASRVSGLPVVVDETNSVSCFGGQDGVSNTSAAGLWALDYGLVMARAGVRALGFHVPLSGCAGYGPLCLTGSGRTRRWVATPVYDGLAVLSSLVGDTFVAGSLTSPHHHLRAYALSTPNGTPVLVAIDLDPADRGGAMLSWQHSAAAATQVLTRFGSADYASRTTGPITTGRTATPHLLTGSTVTQLLPLTPGTASIVAPA